METSLYLVSFLVFDATENDETYFMNPLDLMDPTCYIINTDGTLSEEISVDSEEFNKDRFKTPDMLEIIQEWKSGTKILYYSKTESFYDENSSSEEDKFEIKNQLGWLGYSLVLYIVSNPVSKDCENKWLKQRGVSGVNGEAYMFAVGHKESDGESNILVNLGDSILLANDLSRKNGSILADSVVFHDRMRDSIKLSETIKYDVDLKPLRPFDDADSFYFMKTCAVCKKSKREGFSITACPCKRVYYCSRECQNSDWGSHRRFLHKGIFL